MIDNINVYTVNYADCRQMWSLIHQDKGNGFVLLALSVRESFAFSDIPTTKPFHCYCEKREKGKGGLKTTTT